MPRIYINIYIFA